jgi:small-conductance mechanosensitive channel
MVYMFDQLLQLLTIPVAFAQKASAAEDVATGTQDQITGLVTFIVGQIPLWITAFIVLVASFVLARVVKGAVENKMTQEGFEEEHKEIQIVAGRTANAAVLLIGITVALKIAGLDLTPIIAAGAFGIGFALQDLIMNFLAGVMILSARHYSIGDIIKVNGTMGKIIEIQTRATVLKAFDGTKIIVPNAELFKNQVTSLTSNPFRRIQLINGVAYGSDLKKTYQVVMEAVKNTPGVLAMPRPSMFFYEWGDSTINFKVNSWVDTKGGWVKIRNQLIMNIGDALDRAGIEIPFPTQTILMGKNQEASEDSMEKELKEVMQAKVETQSVQGSPFTVPPTAGLSMPSFVTSQTPVAPTESVFPQIGQQLQPAVTSPAPVETPVPQATAQPVAQTPILNPENFDAPDWLKTAMQKNVVTPMEPAPMGELTINTQTEQIPAPAQQPTFPVPTAFQQVAIQQPVQQMPQPQVEVPVQQPVAAQPVQVESVPAQSAPLITYQPQVVAEAPVQLPTPVPVEQPAVAPIEQTAPAAVQSASIIVPTTI